jgi:hypothetical protein
MKKNLIYLLLSCSLLAFNACKKSNDEPIADSGSKEHYMPLSVGNSWTYNSVKFGEYTVSVTGTKDINSKTYFTLSNSLNTAALSYMRYEGNKLYNYSTIGGSPIELLLVDEDATAGQEWLAGKVAQSQLGFYSYNVKYTCKFVKLYDTYTYNGKTYSNVREMNLQTTISDFKFGSYYTSMYSAEELAALQTQTENTLQSTAVNQTQFYAKGIGYVNQTSETTSALNIELKSYTIK